MQPQYQTPVQQYASYLKSVYTREKLPCHYPCVCRNTAQTAHTELLDDRKLFSPENTECWQTKRHVANPKCQNNIIWKKIVWRRPLTVNHTCTPLVLFPKIQ